MTGDLIKRGNLEAGMHTERMSCEAEGRDQGYASIRIEMQKFPADHQKPVERHGTGVLLLFFHNSHNEPT